MGKDDKVYSEAEVKDKLKKELPLWVYEGNWIKRKYKTQNWKSTLMVINTVGHLAEAAWHHPDITASYAWVEVRLTNHAAKGVTDKDFELAKKAIMLNSATSIAITKLDVLYPSARGVTNYEELDSSAKGFIEK